MGVFYYSRKPLKMSAANVHFPYHSMGNSESQYPHILATKNRQAPRRKTCRHCPIHTTFIENCRNGSSGIHKHRIADKDAISLLPVNLVLFFEGITQGTWLHHSYRG